MRTPENSRVVIVLFVMDGCPACEEFKPTFMKVAKKYNSRVPVSIADAATAQTQVFAEKHKVEATPTMLVMFKGSPYTAKFEGAHSEPETVMVFEQAAQMAGQ